MRVFAGVDAFDIGLDDPPIVHLEGDRDAGMELVCRKFLIGPRPDMTSVNAIMRSGLPSGRSCSL